MRASTTSRDPRKCCSASMYARVVRSEGPSRNAKDRPPLPHRRFRVSSADDPLQDPLPATFRLFRYPCAPSRAKGRRVARSGALPWSRRTRCKVRRKPCEDLSREACERGATSLKINSVKEPTDIRGASRGFRGLAPFRFSLFLFPPLAARCSRRSTYARLSTIRCSSLSFVSRTFLPAVLHFSLLSYRELIARVLLNAVFSHAVLYVSELSLFALQDSNRLLRLYKLSLNKSEIRALFSFYPCLILHQ